MLKKARKKVSNLLYKKINFETYFNVPLLFSNKNSWNMNERIVEWGYVLSQFKDKYPKKVLDFGCSRGWIPLSLASLGHNVTGIDFRDFPFTHPNFKFYKGDILQIKENEFDIVLCLSTLEHVGLGAYGEEYDSDALKNVVKKIYSLLKQDGLFFLTIPVGKSSIDNFEKSFTPDEIKKLLENNGLKLSEENYFQKVDQKHWLAVTENIIKEVNNDINHRKNGVNGIGCFVFKKK